MSDEHLDSGDVPKREEDLPPIRCESCLEWVRPDEVYDNGQTVCGECK